ncbi:MAG: hypothetical protein JSV18_02810 [Candidatus Bathyarchaeota archaeon]|nr:MAG: hypothetical protein JSV18_02810 [Candidatus Bathyarchaeota archaeon]
MSDEKNYGYILRIITNDWRDQVYELKKYYSGVIRAWRRDTPILLAMKTDVGDSFIGYGVVGKVEHLWELPPEEEAYCMENNWKCAITFKSLFKYNKPYPIKESILADDPRKGSFLHAVRLTEDQVDAILEAAEEHQS